MKKSIFVFIVLATLLTGCVVNNESKNIALGLPEQTTETAHHSAVSNTVATVTEATVEGALPELSVETTTALTDAQLAEALVLEFSAAYFEGNTEVMKTYLTEPYDWDIDTCPFDETAVCVMGINSLRFKTEGNVQKCIASLEFKESADKDYFTYLTIVLIKQSGEWRIQFFALEG